MPVPAPQPIRVPSPSGGGHGGRGKGGSPSGGGRGKGGRGKGGRGRGKTPLVLDANHDGVISAVNDIGIRRFNADGAFVEILGAATNGDKMLAMCDINNNDEIDHSEVFGDGTIDPFTRRPLQAADGFIALKAVALSASKKYPDLKIFGLSEQDTVLVNLRNLQRALQRIQCNLGFISDTNVRNLESLRDTEWIKVTNYLNTPNDVQNGVAFAQKSWYLDTSGKRWGADDVWFHANANSNSRAL